MPLLPLIVFGSGFIVTLILQHFEQRLVSYYDYVALIIVIGGTLLVGLVSLPWQYKEDLIKTLKRLVHGRGSQFKDVLLAAESAFKQKKIFASNGALYVEVFSKGLELIKLEFKEEAIKEILESKIQLSIRRQKKIGVVFKNLSKYPPAFGLVGTVFALVNVMKKLAEVKSGAYLGPQMAVALVATLYGLMLANFLLNPIGEYLLKRADEEEEYAIIALNAILLIARGENYLRYVESLKSMAPEDENQRLKVQLSEVA